MLYCAVLCCAVLCRAVPCRAVPCRAVPCCVALFYPSFTNCCLSLLRHVLESDLFPKCSKKNRPSRRSRFVQFEESDIQCWGRWVGERNTQYQTTKLNILFTFADVLSWCVTIRSARCSTCSFEHFRTSSVLNKIRLKTTTNSRRRRALDYTTQKNLVRDGLGNNFTMRSFRFKT